MLLLLSLIYSVIHKFLDVPSWLLFWRLPGVHNPEELFEFNAGGEVDQSVKVSECFSNEQCFASSLLTEHCTSSLRATNRKCVALGQRRGASIRNRRTMRPPVVSAARPSSPTAVATFAPTARRNSVPAVEEGSLCAPTMWETSESSRTLSSPLPQPVFTWSLCFCVCYCLLLCFPVTLWSDQSVLEEWPGTSHRPSRCI